MGSDQPSIVIYSAPFFPLIGGMEVYALNLALGLQDIGCRIEVVTDTISDDVGNFPFPVHRTRNLKEKSARFSNADVVIFVGVRLRETLRALRIRKRVILTHHGAYMVKEQPRTLIMGLAKRLLSRLFTNVSVSRYIAGKVGGRHRVIHLCFDDALLGAEMSAWRSRGSFVFCGRLVSDKGCDVAVRALAEVRCSNGAATLTVIGDGPERTALVRLVEDLGLTAAVTFTGPVPFREVANLLQAHQCLLVPSLWAEPGGTVAIEGLANGCEVILSGRGGMREGVGRFGWVTEPTVPDFAAAMLRVANGESRRDEELAIWLAEHTRTAMARNYKAEILKVWQRR